MTAKTTAKAETNLSDHTEAGLDAPAQPEARVTTKTSAETAAERPAESPTRPARTKTGPARRVSRPEWSEAGPEPTETRPIPTETRPVTEPGKTRIDQSAAECADQFSPQTTGNRAGVVHHITGVIRKRVPQAAAVVVPPVAVVAGVIARVVARVVSGCEAVLVGHRLLQAADRVAPTKS